jgi:hypothetical protein
VAGFLEAYCELLDRFAADQNLIALTFFDGGAVREIWSIQGDTGDPHSGGRNVAILTFEGGRRLVYKPKDMRGARAYLDFTAELARTGAPVALHHRNLVPRLGFGWEAFVANEECRDTAEVDRWFHSMGGLIRLLVLLGGRDFWSDNFLGERGAPAPIDLETLLHPSFAPSGLDAECKIWGRLAQRPLATAAVTFAASVGRGETPVDLGALAPRKPLRTPFRRRDGSLIDVAAPLYLPRLVGQEADPAAHEAQILAGYQSMAAFMATMRELPQSPALGALAVAPARLIWRATWDYMLLLEETSAPELTEDGLAPDLHLQRLGRALLRTGRDDALSLGIAAYEIESLVDRDIPSLLVDPTTAIVTAGGRECGRLLGETPARALRARLSQIRAGDDGSHTDEIRSGLAFARRLEGVKVPRPPPGPCRTQDLEARAVTAGRSILAWLQVGEDGSLGLTAALFNPSFGAWQLGPLPRAGWAGLAGVGLALAQFPGDPQFRRAAGQLCRQALDAAGEDPATLYLAASAAPTLGDRELDAILRKLIGRNPWTRPASQQYVPTSEVPLSWPRPIAPRGQIVSAFDQLEAGYAGALPGLAARHAPCAAVGVASLILEAMNWSASPTPDSRRGL